MKDPVRSKLRTGSFGVSAAKLFRRRWRFRRHVDVDRWAIDGAPDVHETSGLLAASDLEHPTGTEEAGHPVDVTEYPVDREGKRAGDREGHRPRRGHLHGEPTQHW